jgi:hypothetical protein
MTTIGLIVFVFVVIIDLLVLLFDAMLYYTDISTITSRVKRHPLLGIPLLLWQLIGMLGLAIHFYN